MFEAGDQEFRLNPDNRDLSQLDSQSLGEFATSVSAHHGDVRAKTRSEAGPDFRFAPWGIFLIRYCTRSSRQTASTSRPREHASRINANSPCIQPRLSMFHLAATGPAVSMEIESTASSTAWMESLSEASQVSANVWEGRTWDNTPKTAGIANAQRCILIFRLMAPWLWHERGATQHRLHCHPDQNRRMCIKMILKNAITL